jgi:hypothetical protein
MIRRSENQQKLSSDMLAETVQQANFFLSLPTGPSIKTEKSATKNASVIIMPELAGAVIFPDTGKYLKHQDSSVDPTFPLHL